MYMGTTVTGSCTSWFSGGAQCIKARNWLLGWKIDTTKLAGYNWSMTVGISGVWKDQWGSTAQSTDGPFKWCWFGLTGETPLGVMNSVSFWGMGGSRNYAISTSRTGKYNPTAFGFWRSSGSDNYWCILNRVTIQRL